MAKANNTTNSFDNEIWKPCVQDARYAVSNYGRVKRVASGAGTRADKILKPAQNTNDYLFVSFPDTSKVRRYNSYRIHQLVAYAFLGDPVNGQTDVNHKDFDRTNNCADNLEWMTRKENLRHSKLVGRDNCGSRNGSAKLQPEQVHEIRTLFPFMSDPAIAERFGVSRTAIYKIRHGLKWKSLK